MLSLKKFFFLSIFILFITLLFWGIYNISFKKVAPTKNTLPVLNSSETNLVSQNSLKKPQVPDKKISPLSKEQVISPIISPNENSIYYYSISGELKEIDFFGNNLKKTNTKDIFGLINALWSPDKTGVILKSKKDTTSSYFLFFNINNNQLITLDKNINAVSWQAASSKIIYKYFNPIIKKSTLNVSDADGKNWKKIIDLPHDKISFFQIPRSGLISFWNNGDANYSTTLQIISLIGEDNKIIYQGNFGADYLWDNSGNHCLISQTETKNGTTIQLGVIDYKGENYVNLGLPTFVSKCAWSKDNKTIFCALPGNIPNNSILPNDYKNGKFTTIDTFWKIDTVTGEKKRLLETKDMPDSTFDVSQIFLNTDESLLFFVNKIDQKLYKITL